MLLYSVRFLPAVAAAALCASCAQQHRAESPLRDERGTPLVIRMPGVKKGQLPKPADVMEIDQRLLAGMDVQARFSTYLKNGGGATECHLDWEGMTGEVKTPRGETFYAYMPVLSAESAAPEKELQAALKRMMDELSQRARKSYKLYPMDGLEMRK